MTQRHELECGIHGLCTDVVVGARACTRLLDVLAREHSEGDRDRQRRGELGEGSRNRVRENVEVRGLAPDQTAERHHGLEAAGTRDHHDGRRQLEGTRNLELLDLRARGEGGRDRALRESSSDLVVPASAHDRHARAPIWTLDSGKRLPTRRHMPQSSPRMHEEPVSA